MNNLKESERQLQLNTSGTNMSMDRSTQLLITNDRLAKLEKMYEELS